MRVDGLRLLRGTHARRVAPEQLLHTHRWGLRCVQLRVVRCATAGLGGYGNAPACPKARG